MTPKLYMFDGSPPVRAVMMTAKELEIELELKEIDLFAKEHLNEEFIKLNPAHTVPTLDDDGFILFESAAIMKYLVHKYGENDSLCPKDIKKHAIIDQLLHFSTTIFNRIVAVLKPILFHGLEKKDVPQETKNDLFNSFQTLETLIGNKTYLTGDNLTIADLSFATMVATMKIAFPPEMERFTILNAWLERLEKRPSYEVNRKGLEFIRKFWSSKN